MSSTLPIQLDRDGPEPLYRQIEAFLRQAIVSGRLRPGQRLPSVRGLASQLGVGRLTVATAYEQLAADGLVVSRMGFGTIVAPHLPAAEASSDTSTSARPARPPIALGPARLPSLRLPGAVAAAAKAASASGQGRRRLGPMPRFDLRAGGSGGAGGSGTAGGAGLTVGPALERLLREEWRLLAESAGPAARFDAAGDPLLRAAIASHLRTSRGADCEPDRIVVLSGAIIAIGAVARLWLGPDRRVVVEDPGDPIFRRAIAVSGASVVPVPVDAIGLRPDGLPDDAAVALVSPTVHLPTGASMPLARRLRLLAWANATGALVVEDARSDDFILRGVPPVSLQGLDEDGRVIHVGAFGSLLHGGVRLGYAVLPDGLVEPFISALDAIDPGPSPVQQRALGRFLADGHLDRHITRVRRVLLDRQEAVLEAIGRELGWLVDARTAAGGSRVIATIEDPAWTAADVVRVAADVGVAIDSLSISRATPGADRELVVDYGHHEPAELRVAIRTIARGLASADAPTRGRPSRLPRLPTAALRA
jgi:GntR family transcriptional regulator/MocR family aminotransferase